MSATQETALAIKAIPSMTLAPEVSMEALDALGNQFRALLPNGNKLSNNDAKSLAQISILYQLNPFEGEVFYVPNVGPYVGIKGRRKKAQEQSPYFINWVPLTAEEREEVGFVKGDVAKKCELTRCDLAKYGAANRPFVGFGIVKANEQTRMNRLQCAMKRAEKHALTQAYSLKLPGEIGHIPNGSVVVGAVSDEEGDVVTGEQVITGEQTTTEMESQPTTTEPTVEDPKPVVKLADQPSTEKLFPVGNDGLKVCGHYSSLCDELAKDEPYFAYENGKPNTQHIMNTLRYYNVGMVNCKSWPDIRQVLIEHADKKKAA